jgi:hypothetical protein
MTVGLTREEPYVKLSLRDAQALAQDVRRVIMLAESMGSTLGELRRLSELLDAGIGRTTEIVERRRAVFDQRGRMVPAVAVDGNGGAGACGEE